VLLDTNVFLRWMVGSSLPRPLERVLAKPSTECVISIVTGWEITLKTQLGVSATEIEAAMSQMRAALLPIKFRHLDELSRLPSYEDHRDPFDRMLIAQALAEDLPIASSDTRFGAYKRLRVLWD
jgi:PIN domain nuclease of toxin-antitoxin system